MSSVQIQRIVRDRIDTYEDECDLWKEDHERAMLYFDFRELLVLGISLFNDICRLDENWRSDVFKGTIEYDASFENKIRSLVDRFYRTTMTINRDLLPVFQRELDVEHAGEFAAVCESVRGMVTPDDEFFRDDALLELRDQALEDDRNGKTVEYDLT